MRYGEALQHVRLYDETGEEANTPFLDLGQELWSQEKRRLTIWV